jgi:hypothetical protein
MPLLCVVALDKGATITWERHFKCQALLYEAALAACLTCVEHNPVRAWMANTPEALDHTS